MIEGSGMGTLATALTAALLSFACLLTAARAAPLPGQIIVHPNQLWCNP